MKWNEIKPVRIPVGSYRIYSIRIHKCNVMQKCFWRQLDQKQMNSDGVASALFFSELLHYGTNAVLYNRQLLQLSELVSVVVQHIQVGAICRGINAKMKVEHLLTYVKKKKKKKKSRSRVTCQHCCHLETCPESSNKTSDDNLTFLASRQCPYVCHHRWKFITIKSTSRPETAKKN